MMGWSILVDCFHGHATQIAINIRAAVRALLPYINPLVYQVSALHSVGMESLCRVMYELQQDYFAYLHQVAIDAFQDVVNQVATGRVARLLALPHGWYASFEGRPETGTRRGSGTGGGGSGGGGGGGLRERSGTTPCINPKPDAALMTRFRDCGHASINSMIGDHVVECPKHAGKMSAWRGLSRGSAWTTASA
jgi:hypothetical protein